MSKQEQKNSRKMLGYRITALVMASLMILGAIGGVLLFLLQA